jgi:predicted nucleic acid-binding protein
MNGVDLTLDAGALIALERDRPTIRAILRLARIAGAEIHILPGVLAQVWRGGPRQARLAHLLVAPDVTVPDFDETTARLVGELCGLTGHHDVVDVHVVLHARMHGHQVVTSDPDDLRRVDSRLSMVVI